MSNIELSEREQRFLHRAKNKNGESFLYIKEEVEEFKEMIAERAEKAEAVIAKIRKQIHEPIMFDLENPYSKAKADGYELLGNKIIDIITKAKEGL